MTKYKCGTRIEVKCLYGPNFSVVWERARIGRQPKGGYPIEGYYCVTFEDRRRLAVHESGFRAVDNRRA